MSVPEIEIEALAVLHADGAVIIDVREPHEYHEVHVVGARLIPLGHVTDRVTEIPADEAVFVICRSGARSARAVEWLRAQGLDATNVAGGTLAWVAAGKPVATGDVPGTAGAG